jgi:hypothetical protein
MLESKAGKRIFSPGIDDLAITPNPRCDTHQGSSPPKSPRRGRSLGVSVHHIWHGGTQTMYNITKTSFELLQHLGKL